MSEATSFHRLDLSLFKTRQLYILLLLFIVCSIFYYLGEIVTFSGGAKSFFNGVHDVQRLLFMAPIIYSGYFFRMRGAIIVTLASLAVFIPRALLISPFPDPVLRPVLFCVVAGTVGALTGLARNTFDRSRHLEATARNERDKLLRVLETMEDGVVIIGPDYRVRFENPSMSKEFGEGIGSYCYAYLHNRDEPCGDTCQLKAVLGGANKRWEYTLSDDRTYEIVASAIIDSDGTNCMLAVYRNISHYKWIERELVKINQLKSELLSNMSHELKSPLTSIKGIVTSLLQKDIDLDDDTREMLLDGVNEETDRLGSLVTNLLNMSKLEAGAWKPEKETCYIPDIVDEVLKHQKWVHMNHIFRADLEPDLPEIQADYGQIRQVLINLLENAAAYSEEGTEINIKATVVDNSIEVSVSDQGVGIPPEELGKVFEKFYRGTQKRRNHGGAGLGLAICQAIIHSHDGQIWVESTVGQGSKFYFRLPITQLSNN
ncbi:MAG TPA: ATP-binding protein [Dehalococcoidia bacterium]|nr:ATP-binding protein [Dehalococcoidia bacterium]